MKRITYFAVFEPSGKGYSVYFPDLPGCVSYGDTAEAAIKSAGEALGLHLYGMKKDGDSIPAPSMAPKIDDETVEGYFVSPVSIFPELVNDELDNRAVRTNITIPQWLKDWAVSSGLNLSQVLQATLKDMYNSTAH